MKKVYYNKLICDQVKDKIESNREEWVVREIAKNVEKKGLHKKRHSLHWSAAGDYQSNESPQGIQK